MLLLASFALHQTCPSFRDSTQPRNRGQYCLTNVSRENSRNSPEMWESVIACKPLQEESGHSSGTSIGVVHGGREADGIEPREEGDPHSFGVYILAPFHVAVFPW